MDPGPDWSAPVEKAPDPTRTREHLDRLLAAAGRQALDGIPPQGRAFLAVLLSASRTLSDWLIRSPRLLELFQEPDSLRRPVLRGAQEQERQQALLGLDPTTSSGAASALDLLHANRSRTLLRIAIRDLARLAPLPTITLELSDAADVFLEGVLRIVLAQHTARFGAPWHQDADGAWHPTPFSVLGLGKLGGQELNYSSDVDLLFVYAEEGATFRNPPRRRTSQPPGQILSNHAFFKRLGEALIREASGRGVDAGALRIDMRLRPEGDSGPLARSLDSYENFYAEWGQTWERMMLLKARGVAGDLSLAGEFLERVQPFRYPRSLGPGVFREMSEMKARIEREIVRTGELDRNVKLGRGGIRDIEFVVQSFQILHGGRNPFLQSAQTLVALPKLALYNLLPNDDTSALTLAYPFLRDVEHRIQMEDHRQTHTLPDDPPAVTRIARLMGFPDTTPFRTTLSSHMQAVRAVYARVFELPGGGNDRKPGPAPHPQPHAGFDDNPQAWRALLQRRGFRDPDAGVRLLRSFVEGPGFVHVSNRTRDLGLNLIPRLLETCPGAELPHPASDPSHPPDQPPTFILSDPDRVLARLDSYITAYGARASLYELWTARPMVLDHLIRLFDRSEFLAELAIRAPDLVDELEGGGHLRRQKNADQTLADLLHGLGDADQHLWLRRYFQTEFMRLGLRDILGWVGEETANRELSALAEACVEYAVRVVMRRNRLQTPPFAVIALGRFGGSELVYGSDLDVVFVAPNATRNLPRLQKFAAQVVDLLSARTDHGSVFTLDTRLRPDGEKGLLVNVLKTFDPYYRRRAMLWEIQALTRARWVAGHPEAGRAFVDLARDLTNFHDPSRPPAAFHPDWKAEIARMRGRIERERTPPGSEHLAFKTGAGGLVDAEFLAQTCAMHGGWFEPNTLESLTLARNRNALSAADAETLIPPFRHLRRMESILRRWSFEGEAVLPDDPAAQHRVAVRCGYPDATTFLAEIARWRSAIRTVYARHLPEPPPQPPAGSP